MTTIVTNQKKALFNVKETLSKIHSLLIEKGSFILVTEVNFKNKQSQIILKKSTIVRVVKRK